MNTAVKQSESPFLEERQRANKSSEESRVSIVIPCFNESESVENLAKRLEVAIVDFPQTAIEFVLVDDGSTDDTRERLKEAFADFESVQILSDGINRGVMGAILHGIAHAQFPIVCSMDSDCTYAPEDIQKLLDQLDEETSMVIGSPYHRLAKVFNIPAWRIQLSKFANRLYRFLLKPKLTCYTSCFRAYRREHVVPIELNENGYAGTVEMVWALESLPKKIVECPVDLNVRKFGESKLKLIPVVRKHLTLMFAIAIRKILNQKHSKR